MVIDFHTHIFPPALAERALNKLGMLAEVIPRTDGTRAGLLASMASAGVDAAVILPVATKPAQVETLNARALAENGRDGLWWFGAIHPDSPDWEAQLDALARGGIRGVKIHPGQQGVDIDDPRFVRILRRAGALGLAVLVHAGRDPGYPQIRRCAPAGVLRALEQAGPVRLILAHMGGWRDWAEAEALLPDTDIWLDTSYAAGEIARRDMPPLKLLSPEDFLRMVRRFGAERILFGTDSPWTDQAESLAWLRALPLTEAELAAILGENARKFLGLA